MPTPHKRIPVIEDPALAEALARVAPLFPKTAPARLVHDLAIRGAEQFIHERRVAENAIEQLVAFSTTRRDLIDWDVLERVDSLAWDE